jgi:hypothetical protein
MDGIRRSYHQAQVSAFPQVKWAYGDTLLDGTHGWQASPPGVRNGTQTIRQIPPYFNRFRSRVGCIRRNASFGIRAFAVCVSERQRVGVSAAHGDRACHIKTGTSSHSSS